MRYKTILLPLVLAVLLSAQQAAAREAKEKNAPAAQAGQQKVPAFDPQAREILRNMCQFMKSQQQFSFKAEVTDDLLSDTGKPIEYSFNLTGDVRRPDMLRIKGEGDLVDKEFIYDGKAFTLYDKTYNVYATEEVPADIEGALDTAYKKHGLTIALADIASARLCEHMSTGISNGRYEGIHHVRGVPAHHFSFDRGDARFQIWVATGDQPLLKKVVISREGSPYSPRWAAYFTEWDFNPQFQDTLFAFVPPQGAEKIEFAPVQTAGTPASKTDVQKKKGGRS
jgi:hypothetical protein